MNPTNDYETIDRDCVTCGTRFTQFRSRYPVRECYDCRDVLRCRSILNLHSRHPQRCPNDAEPLEYECAKHLHPQSKIREPSFCSPDSEDAELWGNDQLDPSERMFSHYAPRGRR